MVQKDVVKKPCWLRTLSIIGSIIEWTVFAVLIMTFFIVLSPLLPTKKYIYTYIVASGSMEKTIHAGSVAFVKPAEIKKLKKGDIITFTSPKDQKATILHRIYEIKEQNKAKTFITKGDNNNAPDNWVINSMQIKGQYLFSVPYIGHIGAFVKTPKGFGAIVVIPALILAILQIKTIKQGIEEEVERRTKQALAKAAGGKMLKSVIILAFILNALVFWGAREYVQAIYNSTATVSGVTFSVKDFVPPPAPTLVSPANNSYRNTSGMVMDWSDVTDYLDMHNPVYYIYQSARNPGFSPLAYTSGHLTASQIPAPGTPDGNYWWHVKTCDALDNCSDWSAAWKVTVDNTAPTTPGPIGWTIENPPVGSDYVTGTDFDRYATCDGAVNYSPMSNIWKPSTDATPIIYEREVYAPIDNRIYFNNSLINNYENGGGAVNGQTYWVRVRAKDAAGNYSDWTGKCAITYDTTAPIISNVTHLVATPEETNDYLATITWNTDELTTSNLRWSDDAGATWHEINDDLLADNTFHRRQFDVSDNLTYQYQAVSADQAGNTTTSLTYSFTTGDTDTVADVVPTTDIVINEFLPNPTGDDFAPVPGGEWVEIYNRGSIDYDMTGWSIGAYNHSSYRLVLNFGVNTFSSDGNDDEWLSPGEFMVVYRNGDSTFYLKNAADDRIRLFNASNVRVDRYMYTASQVIVNKSIARYPDGSDTWFDPIPTPLGPNILESSLTPTPSPSVELSVADDKKTASFSVNNISDYLKLSYELTYDSYDQVKGVIGSDVDISGKTDFSKEIDLATCSNEDCTYDQNVHNFKLKIILEDKDAKQTVLQQSL